MSGEPEFLTKTTEETKQKRDLRPMLIAGGLAAVLILLAVFGLWFLNRRHGLPTHEADPYASKLYLENLKMSQADVPVGGTITYLDFDATNMGDRTITGLTMEATFYGSQNEPVQQELLPAKVVVPSSLGGYPDIADLTQTPLAPGQKKTLRLTIEQVNEAWFQSTPLLRVTTIQFK
jgi:hypothetical protein